MNLHGAENGRQRTGNLCGYCFWIVLHNKQNKPRVLWKGMFWAHLYSLLLEPWNGRVQAVGNYHEYCPESEEEAWIKIQNKDHKITRSRGLK